MPIQKERVTEQQKELVKLLRAVTLRSDVDIAKRLEIQRVRFYRIGRFKNGLPMRVDEYFNAIRLLQEFYTLTPEQTAFFSGQK